MIVAQDMLVQLSFFNLDKFIKYKFMYSYFLNCICTMFFQLLVYYFNNIFKMFNGY